MPPSIRSRFAPAMVLASLLLAACSADTVAPGTASITASTPTLVPLTPQVAVFFNEQLPTLDEVAQSIWEDCFAAGTAGMNGSTYVTGVNCRFMMFDGYPRRYVVYLPVGVDPNAPVVLMHHGTSGHGERFLRGSGWREQADADGYIVAFPSSLPAFVVEDGHGHWTTKWNAFSSEIVDVSMRPPDYPPDVGFPADDVGFISSILDDLLQCASVDPRRFFVSGFSNGAAFGARLALELSDRVAAAGLFGAGFDISQFQSGTPVPVMLVTGSLDDKMLTAINRVLGPDEETVTEVPMDATALLELEFMASARDLWTAALQLDPTVYQVRTGALQLKLEWRKPSRGAPGGNLLRMEIWKDVVHVYPTDHTRGVGSNNPHDFDAARVLAKFFKTHRK